MASYEEIEENSGKITKKIVEQLSKINPLQTISQDSYRDIKQKQKELMRSSGLSVERYMYVVDKALLMADSEMKELIGINPLATPSQRTFFESFSNHLGNLLTEKRNMLDNVANLTAERIDMEKLKAIKNEIPDKRHAVFISHSVKDRELAHLVKNLLQEFNIDAFVAHDDIHEGEKWEPEIIESVENSTLVIVLGTKYVEDSTWVSFETGLGYDKMFPFLFDHLSDKVSFIKNTQGVTVDYDNPNSSIIKLIKATLAKLGLNPPKNFDVETLSAAIALKKFIENKRSSNRNSNSYKIGPSFRFG